MLGCNLPQASMQRAAYSCEYAAHLFSNEDCRLEYCCPESQALGDFDERLCILAGADHQYGAIS